MRKIIWEYGSVAENLEELRELGENAWEETIRSQGWDIEYDLYDEFFYLCEQRGILGILVGRDPQTRELVGMYVTVLSPYMFCKRLIMSSEVVWYIRRKYMTKSNVLDFFRAVEAANAEWGADYIGITAKDIGNVERARETYQREGYVLTNLFFMREAEGAAWHKR